MPLRVSSAQVSSTESCWLHDVRTLATRDFVTRLHERGSLALSLIRLSGETRAHRSPSARPAFLTVRRLLYSNDSFHSFSSAEFCSAYQTPWQRRVSHNAPRPLQQPQMPDMKQVKRSVCNHIRHFSLLSFPQRQFQHRTNNLRFFHALSPPSCYTRQI